MKMPDSTMPTRPSRLIWLDAARCLACLCVLMVHVTYTGGNGGAIAIAIYDYYAVCGASIVFFMITGALVLWKPRPLGQFMRRRLGRVALPMVIWSILILTLYTCLGFIEWADLPQRLLRILFEPQIPQFWFIYVVMGIYLLTPILGTWLQRATRRQVSALLLAWSMTLFVPWFNELYPPTNTIIDRQHGYLFYFQGYAGVALLGYYLRRWGIVKPRALWAIATIILFTFPLALRHFSLPTNLFTHRLSPNVIALSAVLFVFIKHFPFPVKSSRVLYVAGQMTFGIYLTHMPVIRLIVNPLMQHSGMNYWYGLPLAVTLTALLCGIIVWLLSRTPISRTLGCEIKYE